MSPDRSALMWVFDRLSSDCRLTDKEVKTTILEIGKVLVGRASVASEYIPTERSDSLKLSNKHSTE